MIRCFFDAYRINKLPVTAIIALIVHLGGCAAPQATPNAGASMRRIADVDTDENGVAGLIEDVRRTKPAAFEAATWREIANSNRFPPARRRRAVLELFDRHAAPGVTVRDLALILDHPSWLKPAAIVRVRELGGKIPIAMVPGESVYVIMPGLPTGDPSGIYLRIADTPSTNELYDALLGNPSAAANLTVTAIAIFAADPADKKLISAARDSHLRYK